MGVRRSWVVTAVLSALLLVTGCARGTGTGPGPVVARDYAADDLVVRMAVVGGFVPVISSVTAMPSLSVYGDGRVVTLGATPAIYPGPALPAVQVQHISRTDVSRLADLAIAAGVGRGLDLGQPPVADAPSTRFTVLPLGASPGATGAAKPLVTEVNALTIPLGDHDGLTDTQRAGRRALIILYGQLTDLSKTLGAGALDQPQRYVPQRLAAVASPWQDPNDPSVATPAEQAWPGPALPGEPMRRATQLGCVTVTGDTTALVLAAAGRANTLTPWGAGGKRWAVAFRPLLPDETGCADLGR